VKRLETPTRKRFQKFFVFVDDAKARGEVISVFSNFQREKVHFLDAIFMFYKKSFLFSID